LDVSNAYRAKHPEAAEKWEAYSGARQVKESTTSQLFRSVSGELTRHPRSHHVGLRSGRKVG
jgi:hypothetical protein